MPKFKNILGEEFGKLKIIEMLDDYYTSGGNKKHMWKASCDCGRCDNVIGTTSDFTTGKLWRCTYCVKEEASARMSNNNKKNNKYCLLGEYGIGYTLKGEEFWFDLEDYEKIKEYCWYKYHKYFVAKINGKEIGLHKLIMDDLLNEYDIDHIKTENKFDNRKLNLRRVNRSENNTNKVIQKNNTSGVTGVRFHSRDNVWEANININKKYTYLGRSYNFSDACKLRKEAEEKYYKEHSYSNSQKMYEERTNNNGIR